MKNIVSVVSLLFHSWLSIQLSLNVVDRLYAIFMLSDLLCLYHLRLFITCVTSTEAFVLTSQEQEERTV